MLLYLCTFIILYLYFSTFTFVIGKIETTEVFEELVKKQREDLLKMIEIESSLLEYEELKDFFTIETINRWLRREEKLKKFKIMLNEYE